MSAVEWFALIPNPTKASMAKFIGIAGGFMNLKWIATALVVACTAATALSDGKMFWADMKAYIS